MLRQEDGKEEEETIEKIIFTFLPCILIISRLLFVHLTAQLDCSRKMFKLTLKFTTSLVVQWSESLTTNHEVPGSIPSSTVGIFLEGKDSHGDHGLGRSVEFKFKAPPGTTSSSITTHTPSAQRNCASWASQPQKSVTLLPCPGGRTTKSTKGHVVAWGGE